MSAIVEQKGTVPIIERVPAWMWHCETCGWLGAGLTSEVAATKEAATHLWDEHSEAMCAPGMYGHPAHKWERVPKSDSASRCVRCEWVITK